MSSETNELDVYLTMFRSYVHDAKRCEDDAQVFQTTLDAAMLHTASLGGVVGPREQQLVQLSAVAKEWERYRQQGTAWAETLEDVMHMISASLRMKHRKLQQHVEQVHMGMLMLTALEVTKRALSGEEVFLSIGASLDGLLRSLLSLVRGTLTATHSGCLHDQPPALLPGNVG